jgi:NADPH:quinone reductase-like Zn-dependent oxidoreductase
MSLPPNFRAATVLSPKSHNTILERSLTSALHPDEVGIKITATAINPVDWKMRDHDAFLHSYPAILGSDAAGVIAAVGSKVTQFRAGERVFFQGIIGTNDSSTFQQFCKMPAALVSATPANISDLEAAGISLATMVVATAFYDKTGYGLAAPWDAGGEAAGEGKAIVIIGGASSVGQYAIQLARISGFARIVTNASAANHAMLKELGAHVVLDRKQASADDFAAATDGLPLSFVFDAISVKSTQILSVQVAQASEASKSKNPSVITVHVVHPSTPDAEAVQLAQSLQPVVDIKQVLGIGSSPALRYLSEPLAKALGGEDGYIARGTFKPNKPRLVRGGLEAVEDALALNRAGVSGEKVVVCPNGE